MSEQTPEFQSVAKVGEIPLGEGRPYPVNGVMVAVFHTENGYLAISDACPHQGASLSAGYIEDEMVMCPWHAWKFCLKDGHWADAPQSPLRCDSFAVKVEGEDILVAVPETP